jgi:hypothetical protein
MNKWHDKLATLLRRYETFLFLGLLSWLAVYVVLDKKVFTWSAYFSVLAMMALFQLPVLLFTWFRERLKKVLSPNRYRFLWYACFVAYLSLLFISLSALARPGTYIQEIVPISAICCFVLELLLTANTYYQRRVRQLKWIKHLSLERSLLISIILIAITLAAMAVSSIGNPAYDNQGRLLVGFEFDIKRIYSYFGQFLSFAVQFLFIYLCGYFFFYINNRVLVPKVLRQKGLILYLLSGLATVGILYPIIAQLLALLPVNTRMGRIFSENPFALENAFGAIAIIVLSLPVVLALQWSRQNSLIISLEKDKTQTELDLLKQQLNPHFFFNTLNNLYALSLQQSRQTPEIILQLSELMRYVIYKAKEPLVPVWDEIKYLEDYIELQQIRLQRKPDLQFNRDIAPDTPAIAPLLLIVLVENAFKHGIEPAEQPALLRLSLTTGADKLYFSCVNSIEPGAEKQKGIGLANLQRRLTLLYPGKHVLKTGIENHIFKAELELDLS